MTAMIGLVACSQEKLDHAAPARDLYISSLFRYSLRLAERLCERVYILSARHHLVALDDHLEPYDQALTKMLAKDRVIWGHRTAMLLVAREGALPMNALVLAGAPYFTHLEQALRPLRWRLRNPMQGLQIGQRLAWLSMQLSVSLPGDKGNAC